MKIMIRDEKGVTELGSDHKSLCLAADKSGKMRMFIDPGMDFDTGMSLLLTTTRHLMQVFGKTSKDKEQIWDYFNLAASTILDDYIPERELRRDIQAEVIMELENEKIREMSEMQGKTN